jgi:DNA-binding NtrC family response regulator
MDAPSFPADLRMLIVDDEDGIRGVLRRILVAGGVPAAGILEAGSAEEALDMLHRNDVHIVLTDYRMGGRTGVEVLGWVAANRPHTKRALMTGYNEQQIAVGAINQGQVDLFVKKPWDNEELLSVMARLVETQRAEVQRAQAMARGMDLAARLVSKARGSSSEGPEPAPSR